MKFMAWTPSRAERPRSGAEEAWDETPWKRDASSPVGAHHRQEGNERSDAAVLGQLRPLQVQPHAAAVDTQALVV
jgi:hypothetical protein